jgi:hypothetical protein
MDFFLLVRGFRVGGSIAAAAGRFKHSYWLANQPSEVGLSRLEILECQSRLKLTLVAGFSSPQVAGI